MRVIRRRPAPRGEVDLPALFGRQTGDCASGFIFYRCAINDFAGCCSVDPCTMKSGCPDNNSGGGDGGNNSGGNDQNNGGNESSGGNDNTQSSTNNPKTTPQPDRSTTTTARETTQTSVLTVTTTDNNGQPLTTVVSTTIIAGGGPLQTGVIGGNDQVGIGDSSNDGGGKKLSSGAIAGIVVGALIGIALLAFLLMRYLCMRRIRDTRYNYRPAQAEYPPPMADAPRPDGEKGVGMPETPASTVLQTPQEGYNGVFAPFGGKIVGTPTTNPTTPGIGNGNGNVDARDSGISYVSTLVGSPSPFSRHTLSVEGFPAVPQLDSSPVFAQEMDATPSPRPIPELPANNPLSASAGGAALQGLGVQGAAGANSTRPQSTPLEPVAEDASPPRATLTATDEERSRRTYVTSWSKFEGSPDVAR